MGEIDRVLTDFFEQDGWSVRRIGRQPLWQTGFRGDNASLTCFVQLREDPPQFVFYSICPLNVP